ncbi:MAG: hypothetical protein BGP07_02015 [Rhizobiales bacterium 63-22]|nr:MAG: hypothetical protein BGP07_02015 [Rhizobiales bacterium 63-22]
MSQLRNRYIAVQINRVIKNVPSGLFGIEISTACTGYDVNRVYDKVVAPRFHSDIAIVEQYARHYLQAQAQCDLLAMVTIHNCK